MQSIELIGESKKIFHYFYLILDSKASSHKSTFMTTMPRSLSKENLSKGKTIIMMNMTISNFYHLYISHKHLICH